MIVTYKLLSGLYDEQVTLQLDMATIGQHYTRGNSRKLTVMRCRFDLRKYSFTGHPKSRRNDGTSDGTAISKWPASRRNSKKTRQDDETADGTTVGRY